MWNTARKPGYDMGHFDRTDLPYYYALVDGFTGTFRGKRAVLKCRLLAGPPPHGCINQSARDLGTNADVRAAS